MNESLVVSTQKIAVQTEGRSFKMCFRKKRFGTQHAADVRIGQIRAWYPDEKSRQLRPYKCPICDGYHLTTQPFRDNTVQR